MSWMAWLPIATPLITFLAALVALATYRMNAKTRRAEFLSTVHRDFFVEPRYRRIRDLIDDPKKAEELKSLVAVQESSFTDFLNFFEYLAYLERTGVLTLNDVEASLGYYLRLLRDTPSVADYVHDKTHSFENLDKLLARLKRRK